MTLPSGILWVLGLTVRLMGDGELSRLEPLRHVDQRLPLKAPLGYSGSRGVRC